MIVSISTINKQAKTCHFKVRVDKLEVALEAIVGIADVGDTLLSVAVLDGAHVLFLPVAAFDGQPIQAPIQQLEKEWTQILSTPISVASAMRQYVAGLMNRQRDEHETYIVRLEMAIARLNQHLLDAEERFREPYRSYSISQLKTNLKRYESILEAAVCRRESITTLATELKELI